jgi:hypothetical protein
MTDEDKPLRELVDRSGYAFNMAVAEVIRGSSDKQKWTVEATEIPWSRSNQHGFVDVAIARDRAYGVIECKKVNHHDQLVFLTHHDQRNQTRCRLELDLGVFPQEDGEHGLARTNRYLSDPRYFVGECNMPTGSPESGYCAATRSTNGLKSANLNLDDIASDLLESCEGLLGDWNQTLRGNVTACIPIIVTNARIYTCAFDPAAMAMDLDSGSLPDSSQFQRQPFVRFRKAFRHSPGLYVPRKKNRLAQVVEQGERTVFVVDARDLVPFLAGLRDLTYLAPDETSAYQLVHG